MQPTNLPRCVDEPLLCLGDVVDDDAQSYDGTRSTQTEFAPDLEAVCEQLEMGFEEIVKRHSSPNYLIYGIGFLPGFGNIINNRRCATRQCDAALIGIIRMCRFVLFQQWG